MSTVVAGIATVTPAGAWPSGDTAPVSTISGSNTDLSRPVSVVVGEGGRTIVTDENRLSVYAFDSPGDVAPAASLGFPSGVNGPWGLALDSSGRLYVSNAGNNSVTVYPTDWTTGQAASKTLRGASTGLQQPLAIAFDSTGRMAVVNANDKVTVYAADWADGDTAPIKTLTGASTALDDPRGVAFDAADRMYVTNLAGNTVTQYAVNWSSGNTAPARILSGAATALDAPWGLVFDKAGRMAVSNEGDDSVTVYAPDWPSGEQTPVKTLRGPATGLAGPRGVALTADDVMSVANSDGVSVTTYANDSQTIDFSPLPDRSVTDSPVTLSATASSGLPVSFTTATPSVCRADGNDLSLLAAGTCTVVASQAGAEPDWDPAPPVSRSFTVAAAPGPTPSPTPTPTPTPSPQPATSLLVRAHSGGVPVGERTSLVRSVRTDGQVSKVRAECRLAGRTVPRRLSRAWCGLRTTPSANAVGASNSGKVRVSAAPTCSRKLTLRVTIVAKRTGATRASWQRTWSVTGQPAIRCAARGTG